MEILIQHQITDKNTTIDITLTHDEKKGFLIHTNTSGKTCNDDSYSCSADFHSFNIDGSLVDGRYVTLTEADNEYFRMINSHRTDTAVITQIVNNVNDDDLTDTETICEYLAKDDRGQYLRRIEKIGLNTYRLTAQNCWTGVKTYRIVKAKDIETAMERLHTLLRSIKNAA